MVRTTSILRVLALALLPFGAGCYAHAYYEPEPYAVTTVSAAPYGIETYPYVYYDGRPVYIYSGRYYYRDHGSWYYYQNPPPALVRQRPYVRQAPPAYPYGHGGYGYPQGAPPGRPPGPPASAPPARRYP